MTEEHSSFAEPQPEPQPESQPERQPFPHPLFQASNVASAADRSSSDGAGADGSCASGSSPDGSSASAPPPQSTPPSSLPWLFAGAEGLRAGWSLCVYLAMLAVLLSAFIFTARKIHPPPPHPKGQVRQNAPIAPGVAILNEAVPFAFVLLATWIMSRIEKRPNGVYGMGGRRKASNFFAGLLWGIACISLLIFALNRTGHLVFDGRLLFGSQAARLAAVWAIAFVLVGLLEEYLMRGYLQFTLARGFAGIYGLLFKTRHRYAFGFWTAAVLLSFLFGFGHSSNPGESPIGLLSAGLAGFAFAFSLWRTGSLWWAFGFHASWDWGQSYLYGVADSGTVMQGHLYATHPAGSALLSGGATGPEGSIFILPTFALIIVILLATFRQAHQPPPGAALQPPL